MTVDLAKLDKCFTNFVTELSKKLRTSMKNRKMKRP